MATTTMAAHAQNFDGLYQPAGHTWTCNPDHIGIDGGALAIGGGFIDGVENRCKLSNPRKSISEDSTQFTAICSGEGVEYREDLTITSTVSGVRIVRDGSEILWNRCGGTPTAKNNGPVERDTGDRWGYENTTAAIISGGNRFALSCEPFNPSSTYPTVSLSAPCPTCFPGEIANYALRVGDSFKETYKFIRISNAEGSSSDLDYYPNWHEELVTALMAGSSLNVLEDSNTVASFPLSGSSRAIAELRNGCN